MGKGVQISNKVERDVWEELLRSPLQMAWGSLKGSWREAELFLGAGTRVCPKGNTLLVSWLGSLQTGTETEFGVQGVYCGKTPMKKRSRNEA